MSAGNRDPLSDAKSSTFLFVFDAVTPNGKTRSGTKLI